MLVLSGVEKQLRKNKEVFTFTIVGEILQGRHLVGVNDFYYYDTEERAKEEHDRFSSEILEQTYYEKRNNR